MFGEPWDKFYAIGRLDGLELHLKEAPKHQAERRTAGTTSTSTRRQGSTASRRSTGGVPQMGSRS